MTGRYPKSFGAFRGQVARAYKEALGRPKRRQPRRIERMNVLLCRDYEGPEVKGVWRHWEQWETELEEAPPEDLADCWTEFGLVLVYDAVVEHFDLSAEEAAAVDRRLFSDAWLLQPTEGIR